MKPRPTPKSLRAGQTLFVVAGYRTVRSGEPCVRCIRVDNESIAGLSRWPSQYFLSRSYYSRRQAISAARKLVQRAVVSQRNLEAVMQKIHTAAALAGHAMLRDAARVSACAQLLKALCPPETQSPALCNESLKP